MTYLKTFAGVIALLCAMILSNQTSAQTTQNDTARTWFNFTPCGSQFQMGSVTFNQLTNEVTISFVDRETSPKVEQWDGIKLRWFANVETDLPERKFLMVDSIGIYMSWQPGRTGNKHANMSASIAVQKITIVDKVNYTFICKLTDEQVNFLRTVHALPGQCDGFSFGLIEPAKI